MSMSL